MLKCFLVLCNIAIEPIVRHPDAWTVMWDNRDQDFFLWPAAQHGQWPLHS